MLEMDNIFDDFFSDGLKSLEEGFSVSPIWKEEISKWLTCVRDIDINYYERAKTRVKQDIWKQEEVLAEIRSIYFLNAIKRCVISALEPNRVDLSFADTVGVEWRAEVKCPSYVKEILEGDDSLEDKLVRKQQPKNISETFSFNFDGYADAIRKSVDKFQLGDNNLLIISDDRRIPLIGDPFFKENITTALHSEDAEGKISSVLLLNVKCIAFENIFEYNHRIESITSKLSI